MLSAEGLVFGYGRRRHVPVFDGLDWSVPARATTLLLGPNGAGKSTLLKLLAGFERPRRGVVRVDTQTSRRALYERVGWMPQDVQPARGLTVEEQVEYAAWLCGVPRSEVRSRARAAVASVDLTDLRSRLATDLSGGQLRRLGLAQALVRKAPVLLLDEPTAGLDPAQALVFKDVVRALDVPGGLVISTHQVDDLAGQVDRVAVLSAGQFQFQGTVDEFRTQGDRQASLAETFAAMIGGGGH